jgi:D-serine ammonia-lyase
MASVRQTTTPYDLFSLPDKHALVEKFKGKTIHELRTPALLIDRGIFAKNCAMMQLRATVLGAKFRAHLKTHKVACTLDSIAARLDPDELALDFRGNTITTLFFCCPDGCCCRVDTRGSLGSSQKRPGVRFGRKRCELDSWSGSLQSQKTPQILYGLPVAANKIADLAALREEMARNDGVIRLLVDHPDQIQFLEKFEEGRAQQLRWSVFIKVDGGQK